MFVIHCCAFVLMKHNVLDKKSGANPNLDKWRKRCLRLFFIFCWQQLILDYVQIRY